MQLWTTPFSENGLISNCNTPLHWVNNSQGPWYDCLMTIREYEIGGRLVLKNLGLELDYSSGTMVFLSGKLVQHGISGINENQVCIAQYMRDNVHERMQVRLADWPTVSKTFMSLPKYWFAFPMLFHNKTSYHCWGWVLFPLETWIRICVLRFLIHVSMRNM